MLSQDIDRMVDDELHMQHEMAQERGLLVCIDRKVDDELRMQHEMAQQPGAPAMPATAPTPPQAESSAAAAAAVLPTVMAPAQVKTSVNDILWMS